VPGQNRSIIVTDPIVPVGVVKGDERDYQLLLTPKIDCALLAKI
jgi:hypothetical protein